MNFPVIFSQIKGFLKIIVSVKPISREIREKYLNSLKLYDKIMALENRDEEWFEALSEVGDDKFVIQNTEARLGNDPSNKVMWLIYLRFLEEKKYLKVSFLVKKLGWINLQG